MNDAQTTQLVRVAVAQIDAQSGLPPYDLIDEITRVGARSLGLNLEVEDIVELLLDDSASSLVRPRLVARLKQWDSSTESWSNSTEPLSRERRHFVYGQLGLGGLDFANLDAKFPLAKKSGVIVISGGKPWDAWYTSDRKAEHEFYRQAYYRSLIDKGWDPSVVNDIDESTDKIVGLLADPRRTESFQAKGLVVGYVQSGKTANFTSVIAKAVDAGYKLIIVLTGTIELLRSQTQRRLDMELVGKENIIAATDDVTRATLEAAEYYAQSDEDWPDFLSHSVNPYTDPSIPAIRRLTSYLKDYEELGNSKLSLLDPRLNGELVDIQAASYSEVNVQGVNVRLAVVKKNKTVLERLLSDLSKVGRLEELSAVILDDEADQASVNTLNPRTNSVNDKTAINKAIVNLLGAMPRAQYLAYTATPYANVLIDAESPEQLFPRDFIISLDRPADYMGGADFHDLEHADEDVKDIGNSNELARVRKVDIANLAQSKSSRQAALDSFVLTGAIKLFREAHGSKQFKHHTMLVHESVKKTEHDKTRLDLKKLWNSSGYSEPRGLSRLKNLWEDDFYPVSQSRPLEKGRMPASFDELKEFIGRSVDKIASGHPIIVVNGDNNSDYAQAELDFQGGSVWKILVGGTKLSRGFTVEGLTISYYMRRSISADTMMQAGRWFGFRPGYRDLVRLYIASNVVDGKGRSFDLYEAFEAITSDEDTFRKELSDFSEIDEDGIPTLRPIDVRPLVFQQLPWLRPAAANKMYHARLTTRGKGGVMTDFMRHPERGDGSFNRSHFEAFLPILKRFGGEPSTFHYFELEDVVEGETGDKTFDAYVASVPAIEILAALKKFTWADGWHFGADLDFLEKQILGASPTITDFAVLLPVLNNPRTFRVEGVSIDIPVIRRKRRNVDPTSLSARPGFSGNSFRQRQPVEHIAGGRFNTGGDEADKLSTGTTGALLLTYAADLAVGSDPSLITDPVDTGDIATLFGYAPPKASAPRGRIGFSSV